MVVCDVWRLGVRHRKINGCCKNMVQFIPVPKEDCAEQREDLSVEVRAGAWGRQCGLVIPYWKTGNKEINMDGKCSFGKNHGAILMEA